MKRPKYHFSIPRGWGNDPNGLIYDGEYIHMFYQHYPYAPKWGIMHWGHVISQDMIHWKELDIALTPDQDYEQDLGCWSGTSIIEDQYYLIYTSATLDKQTQSLAYSKDGIHFTKYKDNPVIDYVPKGGHIDAFRDPKIFKRDNIYYCLVGGKIHNKGNIYLYKSHNMINWDYIGYLFEKDDQFDNMFFNQEGVYECPDYIVSGGKDIIITSPQSLYQIGHDYQNIHCSICMIGHLDLLTGHFDIEDIQEIDHGFDFYAPQTFVKDNKMIMIAWKEMWHRDYPTSIDGWCGTYTLPRILEYKDNHIYQTPIDISSIQEEPIVYKDITLVNNTLSLGKGTCLELYLDIDTTLSKETSIKLFQSDNEYVLLSYKEGILCFDRTHTLPINGRDNTTIRYCDIHTDHLILDIYLDEISIEVFINNGYHTMTGNVYSSGENITLTSIGKTIFHTIKSIKVKNPQ